jgi:hypothetical protein
MNRETWLNAIATKMAPRFAELGYPLPEFRVSIGFTSGGMRSTANGECWSDKASADNKFEILIRIDIDDSIMAAAILAHELTHAAVGFKEGHKGLFVQVMKANGFTKPFTSTVPTDAFNEWVRPFIAEVGQIPHAKLSWGLPNAPKGSPKGKIAKAIRLGLDEAEMEIITTAKPKQGTRLMKSSCAECGYTVRVTQKWLDIGPPHCPTHGAMSLTVDTDE